MQYAKLGRTGLKVSRLGFGAMRLPMKNYKVDDDLAIPMIHRAFKSGVNYIDTAVGYCHEDSQRAVGVALKGWRDKIVVSTKNHYYNKTNDAPWWKLLEDSLRLLDIDTIDIYNFHGLNWNSFNEHLKGRDGQLKWMQKAKDQGLIRHICFSFHDTAEALQKLAETGEFDSATLQYNLLDRTNEPVLGAVKKAGLGVVIMGPVGGGRLGTPSGAMQKIVPGAKSVPEVALRFVLANSNVTVALSGMSEMKHVEENVRVAGKSTPLSPAEVRSVKSALNRYKKLAQLYCTGCNYCMPCPAGVNIPQNFTALNYHRVYDLPALAKGAYAGSGSKATKCLACGKCMDKCPQKIDIIGQLRETVRTLDDNYGKLVVNVTPVEAANFVRTNGRFDATITCKMECHNVSDQDVTPELNFKSGRNLAVEMAKKPGQLGPFERARTTLTVKGTGLKDRQAIALKPALAGKQGLVYSQEPLMVAVAPKASAASLKKTLDAAPWVAAESFSGVIKPAAKALATHKTAARFTYTKSEFVAQFDLKSKFATNPTATRHIGDSDRIILFLDFEDALKVRCGKNAAKAFSVRFAFPDGKAKPQVQVTEPSGLPAEKTRLVKADVKQRGNRRRVTLRIPWKVLGVTPPGAGARFGVNFAEVCYRGDQSWQLVWGQGPGACVLLAG